MLLLQNLWIGLVGLLAVFPILAPLPLPGCTGGIVKSMGCIMAGPLLVLNSSLCFLYVGLAATKLASRKTLQVPAMLSATAAILSVVPAAMALLTVNPDFVTDTTGTTSLDGPTLTSFSSSSLESKGVSLQKWMQPMELCPEMTSPQYAINRTSIYRDLRETPMGPHSLDPTTFMNRDALFVLSNFPSLDHTQLRAFFFPAPQDANSNSNNNSAKPGLLIYVHGGGWWGGNPLEIPTTCHAQFAHGQGWSFATLQYRLLRHGWSGLDQVQDIRDGIQHLLATYKKDIDPTKILVYGSSSGAHLTLTASYLLNNAKKGHLIAGVVANVPYTSVEIGRGPHSNHAWTGAWSEQGATERLCEGLANMEECHAKLSPTELVSPHTPPTILVSSAQDEFYNPRHARELSQILATQKIPHVHMEFPLMSHGMELAEHSLGVQMMRHVMRNFMKVPGKH